MDFSNCRLSGKYYGGSERKTGILIGDDEYMVKFQKKTAFGKRNNHISEYIGSHVFEILGFDTQETQLGTYKGEQVVVCKDFNVKGRQFVPFNEVGESSLEKDKESYQYEYADIMRMLHDNSKLTNVSETIDTFWRMFIVDALLGNFDRHGSNWGFIKENNRYVIAPVFDNGSCLFPNMTDEKDMLGVMASEEETMKRIYSFPTSQIRLKGQKSSYYEVISSFKFPECNCALKWVREKMDLKKLEDIIRETPFISDIQKLFYRHILFSRYEHIIEKSYTLLNISSILY